LPVWPTPGASGTKPIQAVSAVINTGASRSRLSRRRMRKSYPWEPVRSMLEVYRIDTECENAWMLLDRANYPSRPTRTISPVVLIRDRSSGRRFLTSLCFHRPQRWRMLAVTTSGEVCVLISLPGSQVRACTRRTCSSTIALREPRSRLRAGGQVVFSSCVPLQR